MKHISKNNIAALALALLLGLTPNATTATGTVNPGISFFQAGTENSQPVFRLDIRNTAKELYFVTITDQQNTVLYEETLRGENISRNFRLNTEELSDGVIRVTINNRKFTKPSVYEVQVNTKQVRETKLVEVVRN